jgi:mRNA interferase YafQ
MAELLAVMDLLIAGTALKERHRDHQLSGPWARHRECHVRSDWLLIYRVEGDAITFERTGTHTDLFG